MNDSENRLGNETIEETEVVTGKSVEIGKDVLSAPFGIKNSVDNIKNTIDDIKDFTKDASSAIKDGNKVAKDVADSTKAGAEATKEAAKAAKDAAKAVKEGAKAGAETVKTGVEAAKDGVELATDAALAPTVVGLAVKKAVETAVESEIDLKKEKVQRLRDISEVAKSERGEEGEVILKQQLAKKKREMTDGPLKKLYKKKKKKVKRAFFASFIAIALLITSTISFLATGNSIAISSLNYSLGDKEKADTYTIMGLTKFVGVNDEGNMVLKTGIEEDDGALEVLGKSVSFVFSVGKHFVERGIDNVIASANNLMDGAKEKLGIKKSDTDITKEDIEAIAQKQDYNAMINLYADYMDKYMDKALDEQRQQISGISMRNGYNEDLTRAAFEAQGNPFSNVDYAALLTAYSVKEPDLSNNSLYKFKSTMEDASKKMLKVSYKDAYQKNIIPLPIYKYKKETLNVNPLIYALYYGDNSMEVRWQVAYGLKEEENTALSDASDAQDDIDYWEKKRDSIEKTRKLLKSNYDLAKFFNAQDTADTYKKLLDSTDTVLLKMNLLIMNLYNKRDTNNMKAFFLNARIKNILSGTEEAHITDIKKFSQDSFDIEVYSIVKDDTQPDGKAVERWITKEEGEIAPLYEPLDFTGLLGYYKYKGNELQKPEVEYIKYGQPTMHPFKSTEVFDLFGLNPDEKFEYSLFTEHEITNQQMYDIEYEELNNLVDLKRHKRLNRGSGHGCTLTKEQIQHYLDLMPADTSLNRKQLCKTAMGLTGAISYQMGGNSDCVGWDDTWWQPTGNDKYPFTGLDCSHFVRWAYHTAFPNDDIWSRFTYTGTEIQNSQQISHDQLMPGDLGFNNSSMATGADNHVGIYICKDEAGNDIWCHCTGSNKMTVCTENRNFNVYYRPSTMTLDGSEYWNDEIVLFGAVSQFNQDEQYIMVQVMLQECSTDDAGKRAVAEASSNYAEVHNATLYQVLTNQVHKNYVSAYKDLFEKHTHNVREATQTDYDILNEAAAGIRIIFPREIYENNRVTQWCSKGFTNSDFAKWTYVKTVGDNDFYMP